MLVNYINFEVEGHVYGTKTEKGEFWKHARRANFHSGSSESIQHLLKALQHSLNEVHTRICVYNLAAAYAKKKNYSKALEYVNYAITNNIIAPGNYMYPRLISLRAAIYFKLGQIELAFSDYIFSLNALIGLGQHEDNGLNYIGIGLCYYTEAPFHLEYFEYAAQYFHAGLYLIAKSCNTAKRDGRRTDNYDLAYKTVLKHSTIPLLSHNPIMTVINHMRSDAWQQEPALLIRLTEQQDIQATILPPMAQTVSSVAPPPPLPFFPHIPPYDPYARQDPCYVIAAPLLITCRMPSPMGEPTTTKIQESNACPRSIPPAPAITFTKPRLFVVGHSDLNDKYHKP